MAAKPRAPRPHAPGNARHIPAHVKRAVWERDGGQCTFVGDTGRRCGSRKHLEFDHIEEVARGGVASVAGIRLRCRAHNQYGAECTFGAEFMRNKREQAQRKAAKVRATAETRAQTAEAEQAKIGPDPVGDVFQGGTFTSAEFTNDVKRAGP